MNGKPDDSYKFGAGRFIMKRGLLEEFGAELRRYGRKPFFVGGPTAISVVRARAEAGLAAAGLEGVFSVHPGHVYHEAAKAKAEEARAAGCDFVVAVGGGRGMDFGKLVAYYLGSGVVMLPTSVSTCAAYSPFSLIYTPEGQTIPGNFCYDNENLAILVDLETMAGQPGRYVVSGMLDAMGKRVEIQTGSVVMSRAGSPLALYAGYLLAGFTFAELEAKIDRVLDDLTAGRVSDELRDLVFLNIPLTGIISALSRGVGQSAIAHELYYQGRLVFTADLLGALHGEIVGVGILPQLYYNGQEGQIEAFRAFLKRVGAPSCLTEIGFRLTDANFEKLFEAMAASSFVGKDAASRTKFRKGLELIAR